jgi:hypothetical protein
MWEGWKTTEFRNEYCRQTRRRKKVRKTRLRWLNDVEEDLREVGVRRWRAKAVDTNECHKILQQT